MKSLSVEELLQLEYEIKRDELLRKQGTIGLFVGNFLTDEVAQVFKEHEQEMNDARQRHTQELFFTAAAMVVVAVVAFLVSLFVVTLSNAFGIGLVSLFVVYHVTPLIFGFVAGYKGKV